MTDDKVIPFKKRPPSEGEMEAYRRMTRNWNSHLRQLLFPEHFKRDPNSNKQPD